MIFYDRIRSIYLIYNYYRKVLHIFRSYEAMRLCPLFATVVQRLDCSEPGDYIIMNFASEAEELRNEKPDSFQCVYLPSSKTLRIEFFCEKYGPDGVPYAI